MYHGTGTTTSIYSSSSVDATVDQPTGALLADLKQRGLFDDTIVIYGGEFGRTSDSQRSGGRDYNLNVTTWLAGGGFKAVARAIRFVRRVRLKVCREPRQRARHSRDGAVPDGHPPRT